MLHFLLMILVVVKSYFCRREENETGEEIWEAVKHFEAVDNLDFRFGSLRGRGFSFLAEVPGRTQRGHEKKPQNGAGAAKGPNVAPAVLNSH